MKPTSITISRYTPSNEKVWNDFVAKAGNATFLFDRKYMDYHSTRFKDHSLLIFEGDRLSGLFIAHEDGEVIYSHRGLTYGGLVLENDARMEHYLRSFFHVLKYYSSAFSSVVYKCFPSPFKHFTSDEDQYAMFLMRAELIGRETNCVFERSAGLPYKKSRQRAVKESQDKGYRIIRSDNPVVFWSHVLEPNLAQRFGTSPVHSVDEIRLLMERFPDNIQLYELHDSEVLAGAIIYVMDHIAHAQYLSATPKGKQLDALDILVDHLVMNVYSQKSRFSFGTSNEEGGRKLKLGLLTWKEGFGARTRTHDTYRIDPQNYNLLGDFD